MDVRLRTDGYGRYNLMDDANLPNLMTLPYIDWCSAFDPTYLNTRAFALSSDNPFFFSGRYAEGLGSPHTPPNYVWPLGIIGRALTATSSSEVAEAITTLAETDGEMSDSREFLTTTGIGVSRATNSAGPTRSAPSCLFRSLGGFRVDAVHARRSGSAVRTAHADADPRAGLTQLENARRSSARSGASSNG